MTEPDCSRTSCSDYRPEVRAHCISLGHCRQVATRGQSCSVMTSGKPRVIPRRGSPSRSSGSVEKWGGINRLNECGVGARRERKMVPGGDRIAFTWHLQVRSEVRPRPRQYFGNWSRRESPAAAASTQAAIARRASAADLGVDPRVNTSQTAPCSVDLRPPSTKNQLFAVDLALSCGSRAKTARRPARRRFTRPER